MGCSSSLTKALDSIVLDTSVLINLHASKYGVRIVSALPVKVLIPEHVAQELNHVTSYKNGEHHFLRELVDAGAISVVSLTDSEYDEFYKLTTISPSLGDGEAATIAVSLSRGFLPVIDEKRGRNRAAIAGCEPAWSIDTIRHPAVISSLGSEPANDALYLALRDGRMRIPLERVDEVISLIGEQRSRECTCLPGYKERFLVQSFKPADNDLDF